MVKLVESADTMVSETVRGLESTSLSVGAEEWEEVLNSTARANRCVGGGEGFCGRHVSQSGGL